MHPDNSSFLLSPSNNVYRFQIVYSGELGKRIKFFIPPGVIQIAANLLVVSPAKAIWKWGQPTSLNIENIQGEILLSYKESLLDKLLKGEDVVFSTENPGMLPFDTGGAQVIGHSSLGSLVYVDLSYSSWPSFTATVILDKKCYDKWYYSQNTKWINQEPALSIQHNCH